VMSAQTAGAASEPEKAIWRRARACSLILAVLLTARLAELLVELATGVTADSATESAADFAHVLTVAHLSALAQVPAWLQERGGFATGV
jgi:hypothetical protein